MPNIFEITDPATKKTYRMEAEDGVTQEQALEQFSSLPEESWSDFEYVPEAPPAETPAPVQTASVEVATEAPTAPPPPAKVGNNLYTASQMNADTVGDYENYEITPFSAEDEQTYVRMSEDPNVSFEELKNWAAERNAYLGPEAENNLKDLREAIAAGQPVGRTVNYERLSDQLLGEYTPDVDPTIGNDVEAVLERGMAYNPMGLATRALQDLFDTEQKGISKDLIRQEYPDLSDDQIEQIHDNLIGEMRRRELINANVQVDERNINSVLGFAGDVVGGASPVDLVSIGARAATLGRRLGGAAATNFLADSALQSGDIAYGAQQQYDPIQGALSAAAGTALQGGLEAVGAGLSRVLRTTPDSPAPAYTGAPVVVPTARKGSKAYTAQIREVQKNISAQVNDLTSGWTNLPEVEVFDTFKGVGKLNNKAIGVYTTKTLEDGTTVPVLRINSEALLATAKKRNVSPESLVEAVTFHESLGHHGLLQLFGKDLEAFLDDIYVNGEAKFRAQVDDWLKRNPKAYTDLGDTRRRILATEEVLAGASEKGPLVRRKLDSLANYIKDFARTRMNVNLKYSQREIRSYLAVAHEKTMLGRKADGTPDVDKNMEVYHGSPHDFDKFDHKFMGKGEGNQVFGWGSYFTSKKQIAETAYRDKLSPTKTSFNGVEAPVYALRENVKRYAKREGIAPEVADSAFSLWQVDRFDVTPEKIYDDWAYDTGYDFPDPYLELPDDWRAGFEKMAQIINDKMEVKTTGKLYKVELSDESKWLEWEEPLSAQPELQAKLEEAGFTFSGDRTGEQVYREMAEEIGSRQTSLLLAELGYTGNRYVADNFKKNRARKNDGTDVFNYVVFDDATPQIVDKYMMGDEGRIEDQDFDGRMSMILRELQDEYVPTQRSQAEARRAAGIAGLRSRQYKSEKGLEDLDVRLFQYDAVNERYQSTLLRLTDRMESAKAAEDLNSYVRASDEFKRTLYEYKALSAKIQGDQAQIARALNAMKALNMTKRKISDTLGLLNDAFKNKTDAEAFDALNDPATLDALAKMMSAHIQAGNTVGAAKVAEKVGKPYWWQYVLSYLHNSMLSGLGTHAVNAYDAVNVLGRKLEERVVGGTLGTTRRAFGAKDTMSFMEGVGFTYGIIRAFVDAETYRNTYRAFKEGYEFQPFDARIERQDARIPGLSVINDALYASDMFWRSFHMSANLYSLGVRKAFKEGFRGKDLFEEAYANAINADKELMDEAKRHADEALLVDSPSAFTSWLETGKSIKPGMTVGQQTRAFTLNLLFPFLRVSDRLVFQSLKRIPLVAFLDHNTRREWGMGGAARDAVIARQLMGGALMSYYWMMADPDNQDQEGYIEGYGPEDYQERMGLESTGYRAETVTEEDQVMRNANQINVTANPLNTRNNIAVLVASIRQQWEQSKKTDKDANEAALLLTSAMRASGTFLLKQGYAGNVSPYVEALEAGPNQESAVANAAADLGSRAVPAIVRQFNQMYFDPIKRDTAGDKSFTDRVTGRVQAGIPGLSDLLPANLTALGEEQEQGRTLLRLGDGTEIKQGDPYTELRRLERDTEKPLLTEFRGSVTYEGENIKLNAVERNKWQALQGQYLRDVMYEWVTSEDWKEMSDEDKIGVVKDIKKEAYDYAKEELLDEILTARGK